MGPLVGEGERSNLALAALVWVALICLTTSVAVVIGANWQVLIVMGLAWCGGIAFAWLLYEAARITRNN